VEIKKIALSVTIFLVAVGALSAGWISAQGTPPEIRVGLALTDSQESYLPERLVYNEDDPIRMVITLRNMGSTEVITTKGFSQRPFHLLLIFTDPQGKTILTLDPGELYGQDASPPRVFPVADQYKQVEPVERLPGGWTLSVEIPDARAYYELEEAGNYSVKAVISMRTYNDVTYPAPPEDYSEIDDFKWSGALQSDVVNFALWKESIDHITISPESSVITLGGSQSYTATAYDSSGNSLGDVTSGAAFTISGDGSCAGSTCSATAVGEYTVTGSYEGKTDTVSLIVDEYSFSGFFSPVGNPPVLNTAKAGSSVPVKFSLMGRQGLDFFASGYPTSFEIKCDTGATATTVEETVTAGGSVLSYDQVLDQYTYVWKTDKKWANTCRQFVMKLKDEANFSANFKFVK
jgi:hypothetical protein